MAISVCISLYLSCLFACPRMSLVASLDWVFQVVSVLSFNHFQCLCVALPLFCIFWLIWQQDLFHHSRLRGLSLLTSLVYSFHDKGEWRTLLCHLGMVCFLDKQLCEEAIPIQKLKCASSHALHSLRHDSWSLAELRLEAPRRRLCTFGRTVFLNGCLDEIMLVVGGS